MTTTLHLDVAAHVRDLAERRRKSSSTPACGASLPSAPRFFQRVRTLFANSACLCLPWSAAGALGEYRGGSEVFLILLSWLTERF